MEKTSSDNNYKFKKHFARINWKEWRDAAIWALLLAIFVRTLFFEPYKIPTTSMVPTLIPGDKIFVSKVHYGPRIPFVGWRIKGFTAIKRGDIVVFIAPPDRSKCYVKRAIGIPGDKVSIMDGKIFINDQPVKDPKISKNYYYDFGDYFKSNKSIIVPKGSYFMLGDNSAFSKDSRYWGFVSQKDIIGKSLFIWWPLNRVQLTE